MKMIKFGKWKVIKNEKVLKLEKIWTWKSYENGKYRNWKIIKMGKLLKRKSYRNGKVMEMEKYESQKI